MHLMALGMFLFETGTLAHDDLQRRSDWRHARTGRFGARDAAQYIGPGEETISLSGAVYDEIADGRVSIDTLRDMADIGEAWPLVDGSGTVFGTYVITMVDERHVAFMQDGRPRRIDFALDLLRVDDPAEAAGSGSAAA
ncbi:phage tail protein [Govanella unica]|uniref:Phage tail protein n=1 Tax=Govanella unica TaxID=2975056 RepID=A0A9X3TVJ8_9PROT|nr:phage tail protein [Govania unica]MDA5192786.1 phage tail protein [Govania unica]